MLEEKICVITAQLFLFYLSKFELNLMFPFEIVHNAVQMVQKKFFESVLCVQNFLVLLFGTIFE